MVAALVPMWTTISDAYCTLAGPGSAAHRVLPEAHESLVPYLYFNPLAGVLRRRFSINTQFSRPHRALRCRRVDHKDRLFARIHDRPSAGRLRACRRSVDTW